MLTLLQIRNLAVVNELGVEFRPGLNVITGETGAGKSILVGALSLLLGERADRSLIRTGESQCSVECVFALDDTDGVDRALVDAGAEPCRDGQLILRRAINSSGGGQAYANGSAVTLAVLKKIGDHLVDMHGPHDHQSLLNPDFQMDILDSFALLGPDRAAYEAAFDALCGLRARRQALDCDDTRVEEQMDFLAFQAREITEAAPADGEEEQLKAEHARIANAHRILETADAACRALTDAEGSASDSLAQVQARLAEIEKIVPESAEWMAEARTAAVHVQELSRSVSSYAHGIEPDPERLQWLEDRLAVYQKLRRKYGNSVAEILAFLRRTTERLDDLRTRGRRISELDKLIAEGDSRVRELGKALGKARRLAARKLAAKITAELSDLGFGGGAFDVTLTGTEPSRSGTDGIEFGFAPNVGETMRPLAQIASSGEISRVMLATKAVLSAHDKIPVLVFDEIDANVGGEMGAAMGAKLMRIASAHQVLCITHLPQVAAFGATHFAVSKEVRSDRTFTAIRPLTEEERVREIARMIGGRASTALTLENAREMLHRFSCGNCGQAAATAGKEADKVKRKHHTKDRERA